MKALAVALMLSVSAASLAAEEAPLDNPLDLPGEAPGEMGEGLSLFEEGAKLFLRGLAEAMEPAMRDMGDKMQDFALQLEPVLRELARMVDDFSAYEAPERLPNGDIIIRRKRPGADRFGPRGETDL